MWIPDVTLILLACMIVVWALKGAIHRYKHGKIYAFIAKEPGPILLPIIGNAYVLAGITTRTMFRRLALQLKKYKRRSAYWIFDEPYLFTSDLQVVRAVLGSAQHVTKPAEYEYLIAQGNGVLTTNGAVWRKARKIINPAFRTSILEAHSDTFRYHTNVLIEKLRKHAVDGDTFDVLALVHTCNIDLVCDTLLGCRLNLLQNNQLQYSRNMNKTTEILCARFIMFHEWSDLIFSLVGKQKTVEEGVKPMQTLMQEVIERKWEERMVAKNDGLETPGRQKSFMELILDNVESGVLTKHEAIEESGGLFLGGTITTAVTTSWVFKILAMMPEIQEKVYQEVIDTCGGQEVTFNDLSKLVYLKMVIEETMRHFAVPIIGRYNDEDVILEDGSTIPAGMNIILTIFELHHDPEYWERPGEFYPEHFSPENEIKRPKGVYAPFLTGPRSCPGSKYAMNAMRYIISNILLRYKFHSDDRPPADFREEDYIVVFVLTSIPGFRVKITERKTKDEPSSPAYCTIGT